MNVPLLRLVAVGEFSAWARQFFNSFEENELVELTLEPSVDAFCGAPNLNNKPSVVVIENNSVSRTNIQTILKSGKPLYMVWMGKSFTKEDLSFALESRIYFVLESAKADEKLTIQNLKKLSGLVETDNQFEQILRAMKSILLQTEAEFPDIPMMTELRTAVKRLEGLRFKNEFNHREVATSGEGSDIPFHKTQTLDDVFETIHELERTGVLWVRGENSQEEGKIEFLQGKPTYASAGGCEGVKAILRMFLWDKPRFLFNRRDPRETSVAENMEVDIPRLVKNGLRGKERFEAIRKEVPLPGFKIEVNSGALNEQTALDANDFSTLSSVVEFGSVQAMLNFNPLPDIEIYESLINLRKSNMIRRVSE